MTPGCTVQACGIRDSSSKFAEFNTVVLGISPDSVDRLVKFEDKQELNFTLLSDEDHSVIDSFGAWDLKKFMGREFMGLIRSTFAIKDQKIIKEWRSVKVKDHALEVLDFIKNH